MGHAEGNAAFKGRLDARIIRAHPTLWQRLTDWLFLRRRNL